jgi:hypothetical protein
MFSEAHGQMSSRTGLEVPSISSMGLIRKFSDRKGTSEQTKIFLDVFEDAPVLSIFK